MKGFKIAGVTRSNQYSPNHIGNDAAIFDATVAHLREAGCVVNVYSEETFRETEIPETFIFNMARNLETIQKLKKLESKGCVVINSGYGIENCTREQMTRLLLANDIPHPRSIIVNTNEDVFPFINNHTFANCWIKRGDFHAIHREDVSYVRNPEEGQSVLREYALRGIRRAVINEHLKGDLVKFYGISNSDFFFWFYPFDMNHSKFGLEKINGEAKGIPFDLTQLKNICQKASDVLQVKIYGGDCIVAEDGSIRIIDFNDWPSFAPCRIEAAPYIAQCILQQAALGSFRVVNQTLKLI